MILRDLIYIFDKDLDGLKIQVCKFDDWDEYDTIYSDSTIIKYIGNKKVKNAAAIAEDVIRVDLEWGE